MSLIKWSDEGGDAQIGLPGDLDLGMSGPLLEALRHALAQKKPIRIVADQVERLGAAPLQAIYAAAKQAAQNGQGFVIAKPSEVFIEACGDLGLADWLKKWSAQ